MKVLREKGYRAALVPSNVIDKRMYPPPRTIAENRNVGKLWCCYCGDWRYFAVPKFHPHAEVASEEWFLNAFHNQLVKVCKWCRISEDDFYIRRVNDTWGEKVPQKRRSSSSRRTGIGRRGI